MKILFAVNTSLILSALILVGCENPANTNTVNAKLMNANTMNANVMNINAPVNSNMMSDAVVTPEEKDFMTKAAQANMAEIKDAQMALQKSSDAQVKQLAQKIIDDHTKAGNELKDLAAKHNITLPADVNEAQKKAADDLSKLSGKDFDKKYVDVQIDDHEKAVALFQGEADKGKESDAKAFAQKTLPALKSHLEMAKVIKDKM